MATDLVVRLSGEDTLTPTLEKVKKELTDVGATSSKLDTITQKFNKIQNSTAPLKRKLRDMKSLMAEMNIEGLTDTDQFSIMAQQAGAYSDALGDASTAVKQFADDNLNLNASVDAMTLVTSTASVLTGAMGLFGIENENVNEAILKVQSSLALLNGVQAIANVLNKDSALMLKLQALATTGASITTTSFTAALSKNAIVEALATAKTKISTIAQTAWNVAKAIGMAMLGNFTGLALLAVGAVVGLAMATKNDTDATEDNNDKKKKLATTTEYLKEQQIEASKKINEEAGKLISTYKGLQTQFNSLGSDVEKAEWLEENKRQFQQLGFEIDNVTDAEDFFNKSSGIVIDALKKRAKAAALYQLYLEALQKQYELNNQTTVHYKWNYEGEKGGEDFQKQKQKAYNEAVRELQNKRRNQNEHVKKLETDWSAAQEASNEADLRVERFRPKKKDNQRNGGNSNKNKGKERLNPLDDDSSYKFAKDMVSQIQGDLEKLPVSATVEIENAKKNLEHWQREVEARKLVITPEVNLAEGSLEYAEDMLSKSENALKSLDLSIISPEDLQLALKQVDDWKKEVEQRKITLGLEVKLESTATIQGVQENKYFEKGSLEDKRQSLSNANSIIGQTTSDLENKLITPQQAQEQLDEVNKMLQSIGLEPLHLEIDVDEDGNNTIVDSLEKQKEKIQKEREELENLKSVLSGMSGNMGQAIEQFRQLREILDNDQASDTEKVGAALSTVGASLQAMGMDGPVAKIGATMAAIGQIILGFATASAQAGTLGPFGWLAFVGAGLAAVATMVSTIQAYATGGIVGGTSYSGDKKLIRVNSGEMILNRKQQANLYKSIRDNNLGGGIGSGGEVKFRISGRDLVGVINNHHSKMDKL